MLADRFSSRVRGTGGGSAALTGETQASKVIDTRLKRIMMLSFSRLVERIIDWSRGVRSGENMARGLRGGSAARSLRFAVSRPGPIAEHVLSL